MMGVEAATVLSYVGALAGPADGDGKRVLHGVVTDEKGEPLPGVAVFPTNYVEFGAATDNDGKYVLQNVLISFQQKDTIIIPHSSFYQILIKIHSSYEFSMK